MSGTVFLVLVFVVGVLTTLFGAMLWLAWRNMFVDE